MPSMKTCGPSTAAGDQPRLSRGWQNSRRRVAFELRVRLKRTQAAEAPSNIPLRCNPGVVTPRDWRTVLCQVLDRDQQAAITSDVYPSAGVHYLQTVRDRHPLVFVPKFPLRQWSRLVAVSPTAAKHRAMVTRPFGEFKRERYTSGSASGSPVR
ncbi:hypothetical protein FA13DRAFT_1704350 [Coprinellus micaceus]|uniref:Uncharacterized protein n=1 Tax=Coprinellus micaceus TaxID=71717 RepID=A0A4Y7TYC8_COPMI|nr:hypothetical protein FA13DRAFT_1704350 [Coprinellus micaceus]